MYKLIYNQEILEIFSTENDAKKYLITFLMKNFEKNFNMQKYMENYLDEHNEYDNLLKQKKYDEFLLFYKKANSVRYNVMGNFSIKEVIPLSNVRIRKPKNYKKILRQENKKQVFK